MCIRVLIADDQPSARRSLHALLTAMRWSVPGHPEQPIPADFFSVEVVGVAENGRQAVEQVQALYPDVVVMDLHLHTVSASAAGMDGLATMYSTSRTSVLVAGADAFLLKACGMKELMEAVIWARPSYWVGLLQMRLLVAPNRWRQNRGHVYLDREGYTEC